MLRVSNLMDEEQTIKFDVCEIVQPVWYPFSANRILSALCHRILWLLDKTWTFLRPLFLLVAAKSVSGCTKLGSDFGNMIVVFVEALCIVKKYGLEQVRRLPFGLIEKIDRKACALNSACTTAYRDKKTFRLFLYEMRATRDIQKLDLH